MFPFSFRRHEILDIDEVPDKEHDRTPMFFRRLCRICTFNSGHFSASSAKTAL